MTRIPQTKPLETKSGSQEVENSSRTLKNLKVALVCDWLTVVGGAEQVLREIHHLFPSAPIYTSQYRPKGIDWFKDAEVKTGWINLFPAFLRRFIAPLRQGYFKHLDLTEYDLVISVSGCDAKYVKTKPGAHFCYCHVPTQYYWGKTEEYQKDPGFGPLNFFIRPIFKLLLPRLRKKDLEAAARPDHYITISEFAKAEIKKFYKREAEVIYPPVNTKIFSEVAKYKNIRQGNCRIIQQHQNRKSQIEQKKYHHIKSDTSQIETEIYQNIKVDTRQCETVENSQALKSQDLNSDPCGCSSGYFINFSRQVGWKRLDLAILACLKENQPLILIGDGPEHKNLERLASRNPKLITLHSVMPQSELKEYLKNAKAFIFPSEEPFGIAPVEALAAGCPVIGFNQGGAKDYILDGKNGLFFEQQSVDSLAKSIKKFNQIYSESENRTEKNKEKSTAKNQTPYSSLLSPQEISETAEKFSNQHFKTQLEHYIKETLKIEGILFYKKQSD
ncbi:glycosyltransferase [Candidatus Saccharibacteria bacterium]|nr:glycosyltransferase [Candidatus Saccharibacteria bacterium]